MAVICFRENSICILTAKQKEVANYLGFIQSEKGQQIIQELGFINIK